MATALDRRIGSYAILALIAVHVIAWTGAITIVKWNEGPNSDSTEAYAWGQSLLWGYGKHPPLTGWVAWAWFNVFPAADWCLYALALVVSGCTLWTCWILARRVVGQRRAFLIVLLLMMYPVLSFKATNFNPDLLQAPLFALVALAFVVAFDTRTMAWGIVLGAACLAAVLTKYWAVLVVGAVGISALLHPDRRLFFRSAAPYAAVAVFMIGIIPHLHWLIQADYAPLVHAEGHVHGTRFAVAIQAGRFLLHHAAWLLPVAAALLWSLGIPRLTASPDAAVVARGAARHVWIVVAALVVAPPVMAVLTGVYLKVDWGIPLYTLVPLAIVAAWRPPVPRRAIIRSAGLWALTVAAWLVVAPMMMKINSRAVAERPLPPADATLAADVTRMWRDRFKTAMPVIVGPKFVAANIAFYSPDHPTLFTNVDLQIATWIKLPAVRQSGYVGICPSGWASCIAAIRAIGNPTLETEIDMSRGPSSPSVRWTVLLASPTQVSDRPYQPAIGPPSGGQ